MVPRAVLIVPSVVLLLAVIFAVAQAYEPYDKKADQLGLADVLSPYEKRGKTKFIRNCSPTEGTVCTCDMRFSKTSGKRYSNCRRATYGLDLENGYSSQTITTIVNKYAVLIGFPNFPLMRFEAVPTTDLATGQL